MKRTVTLIACAAVCFAMMVSCKGGRKAQGQEPSSETISEMKQDLADSVLAQIDALAEKSYDAQSKSFFFGALELTDAQKAVKPDYLLDPSVAGSLVTKAQKTSAFAIYVYEMVIRKLYDMPLEETKAVVAQLAAEIDHPLDAEYVNSSAPVSEKIKKLYEICKERGDLAYFWQLQYAFVLETSYFFACDPEFFYSKITNEQWLAFCDRFYATFTAIKELAQYDDEMSQLWEFICKYNAYSSEEERANAIQTIEAAKQHHIVYKELYVARRSALLQ